MYRLNHNVSFKEKGKVVAVYYRFSFYFFKNESMIWLKKIIDGQIDEIPKSFLQYLERKKIIYECK